MSCPFSSAGSEKKPKLGQVCPVTGKGSTETNEEEESPVQGCYISKSGGLDFSVYNQLDGGKEVPLTNIPHILTLSNLKDLLRVSNAVKIPTEICWDDVFFCTCDILTPLSEDKPLSQLDFKSGSFLHMANKNDVSPLFIKVILPNTTPIGLYYVPPWTTPKVLKLVLTPQVKAQSLDGCKCFIHGTKLVETGKVDVSCFVNEHNGDTDGVLVGDDTQLSTFGNLLEVSLRNQTEIAT